MQHAADAQHHFRTEDIKILSRESGWHERGIKESIYNYTSAPYPHLSTAMRAATTCPIATTPSSKMPFGSLNHRSHINRLKLASALLSVLQAALASGLFLLSHKSRL